jgi:hypothetical protein
MDIKLGYSFLVKNTGIECFSDYLKMINEMFGCFGIPINHFYVTYSNGKKSITKFSIYNDSNLQKYEYLSYNEIGGITATNNATKFDFPTNFTACVDITQFPSDNSSLEITITFKTKKLELYESLRTAITFVKILNNYCDIVRGFGLALENDRIPEVFLKGISNPGLSKDQEKIAYSISNNKFTKSNKLPDVFLVNILPKALFKESVLNEVVSIVGLEHLLKYDEKYILFDLPITIEDYLEENGTHSLKKKLSGILKCNNLLDFREFGS